MTGAARALHDAIIADWPPGHFDRALPLLRAYCALTETARRIDREAARQPIGSRRWRAAVNRSCALTMELVDMAAALGLLPGDRHRPPPDLH